MFTSVKVCTCLTREHFAIAYLVLQVQEQSSMASPAAGPPPLVPGEWKNQDPTIADVRPSSGTLTEFTRFPKLASEIRNKIWLHAAREPIIVGLRLDLGSWRFLDPPPYPVFHTCRESRREAIRYVQKLEEFPRSGDYNTESQSLISLNLSNGIFLLQMRWQECRSPEHWRTEVREITKRTFELFYRSGRFRHGRR